MTLEQRLILMLGERDMTIAKLAQQLAEAKKQIEELRKASEGS